MSNINKSDAENMRAQISPENVTTLEVTPVRYQSKYFQLSFKPDLMHQDLIAFFISKGLVSIAVFQSDIELRVFLAFDIPKDFTLCNRTNMVLNPKYFSIFFGGAVLRGSASFDNDIEYFKKILRDTNNYEPLLWDEKKFMFNLEIKDIYFFDKMFSKNYLNNLDKAGFEKYQNQLLEYRFKLEAEITCFNDLAKRIDQKIDTGNLGLIKYPLKQIPKDEPKPAKVLKQEPTRKILPTHVRQETELISNKDVRIKPLSKVNKPDFFALLDKGLVDQNNLSYFLNIPFDDSKNLIKAYIQEKNINVSRSKNDLFRILAMYYKEKSMPKTSDPNTWLKRLKDQLPKILLDFYKKYL